MQPSSRLNGAFTLLELLIVISIIAILASLALPAASNALNSAKKTTAKNQAVQIATAITAYETEYGQLPAGSSGKIDKDMVGLLTTNNPRGISFIELNAWKAGKGGINGDGDFSDPFGSTNVYCVALDTNYANQITVPTDASGASSQITKHIGVWTITKIGKKPVLINSWD
jgi:prepilin-type N-terminal cleavage/methylation domain-containing protein